MKFYLRHTFRFLKITSHRFLLFIFLAISFFTNAQQGAIEPVTTEELNTIVDSIAVFLDRYHITPTIGKQIVDRIETKNNKGAYAKITDPQTLADTLAADLRAIDGDLHMYMDYRTPDELTTDDTAPTKVNNTGIWGNYGVKEIKVLDGNVGYLKIKHFGEHQFFEETKPVITAAIASLKNADAMIVDVRDNGGGFEDMVAYYISYFFDATEPIHLSDYRCTIHDHTYGISTDPNVLGTRLPNTKLYVLVNANTGSAAESFAYMLKHLGRATIIGEVTAGAGNGASWHTVNERFRVLVTSEETINAVTKTSFEKVGVQPDIPTSGLAAFDTGYQLALEYLKETNPRNIHPSNYDKLIDFITPTEDSESLDTAWYQKYAGIYKGGTTKITITRDNNILYGQMRAKGGKYKLTKLKDQIFKVGDIKERIQFILDPNGQVIQLKGIDSPMELNKVEK
jgi:hypothetical protein